MGKKRKYKINHLDVKIGREVITEMLQLRHGVDEVYDIIADAPDLIILDRLEGNLTKLIKDEIWDIIHQK